MDRCLSFAPATVGNVGPCYDIMGFALNYVGDFAEVQKTKEEAIDVEWGGVEGPLANPLRDLSYKENTAWIVANDIWHKLKKLTTINFGVKLTLHKYMPIGTGLGSSACSGVAAARSLLTLVGVDLPQKEIIASLQLGEEQSSGTGHPDNVVPSFYGGFYFMMTDKYDDNDGGEKNYYSLQAPKGFIAVVIRPELSVTTKDAREKLREYIEKTFLNSKGLKASDLLRLITEQSVKAADMVLACQSNDVKRIGAIVRNNDLLEIPRGKLIPHFKDVKTAALKAGAYGCSISGSGPSVVAITDDKKTANTISIAMKNAFDEVKTKWLISPINNEGAKPIENIQDFLSKTAEFTDMMNF